MLTAHSRRRTLQPALAALLGGFLLLAFPIIAAPAIQHSAVRTAVPSAADLFVHILQADDLFTYKGRQITTYWTTGRATDVQIFHQPPDLSRIYYLDPETMRGRLLASDGRQEWQYDPHRHELRHRLLSPGALDEDDLLSYTLLRANYLLNVDPHPQTWAERKVWQVTIKRPGGRTLARKFWVDAGSGLILKREIYREDGRLAVTAAFSDINFHPKPGSHTLGMAALATLPGVRVIETRSVIEAPLPLSAVSAQLAGQAKAPSALAGYRLVGASTTTGGPKPLLHLRYSDGLNLVSLFEQRRTLPLRPTRVPTGMRAIQIGAVRGHVAHHAALTTLNWDTPSLNVTLMGELGVDALHTLAVETLQAK